MYAFNGNSAFNVDLTRGEIYSTRRPELFHRR